MFHVRLGLSLKRNTLSRAYQEFVYNEHPATISRFLCIKIIDRSVKKFGYNEQPLVTSSFFLLVVSGVQCKIICGVLKALNHEHSIDSFVNQYIETNGEYTPNK